MFDNVAINVVIGLILIYLLYSLFATIVSEIIATKLGLRARNLKEAVDRMLNDEKEGNKGFGVRLWDSLKLMKNPKNPRIVNFYNHPEIKYLGSTGIFKVPSQFKAISFSKTVLNLLNEVGYKKLQVDGNTKMRNPDEGDIKEFPVLEVTKERITAALEGIITDHEKKIKQLKAILVEEIKVDTHNLRALQTDGEIVIADIPENRLTEALNLEIKDRRDRLTTEKQRIVLDHETAKYVLTLWKECHGDLTKLRLQLETWFDRTMEQCLEWYKRKIQVVLFLLGFFMAWSFNADTFRIVHKLSEDKDARDKLVAMASAYSQNQAIKLQDTTKLTPQQINDFNRILESLKTSEEKLKTDMAEANSILGLSSWLPDVINFDVDSKTKELKIPSYFEPEALSQSKMEEFSSLKVNHNLTLKFSCWDKWSYFFGLFGLHFWGYVITALAISLGAPFWFDLLNKIMRLRTAVKQPLDSTKGDEKDSVSPLNRIG